jgi:hypothetical protein
MERELSPRREFLRQMAAAQDAQLRQEFGVAQQKALLRQHLERRQGRRPQIRLGLVGATLAAAAAIFAFAWPRPMTFAVGDTRIRGEIGAAVAATESSPTDLTFSDGSFLALGARGRARVTSVDEHGAAILVERGHADVSIVPRKNGSWRVDAGPFEIHVKGTRFSFDWDPSQERLDFRLHHGAVSITAACLPGGRELVAGQSLQASCRTAVAAAAASSASSTPSAPTPAAEAPSSAPVTAAPSSAATTPSWRQLASQQDYRGALGAAVRLGFEDECRRASAADLLLLGDAARLAGDPARAVTAYEAARRKHSGSDRSAFALGLVEFDQRRHYARAAEWFATYLREQPGGPLAEEAQGRLMDAWQRAGSAAQARSVAEAYLLRHPRGQYADLARRLTRSE